MALAAPFLGMAQASFPRVEMKEAFPNLKFDRPVWMTHAGDGSGRFFLIEQAGKIYVFPNDRQVRKPGVFLDLTSKTKVFSNEEGCLFMAFHPDYKNNGKFYVYYSVEKPRRTVLSEFQVSKTDPNRADPGSERSLFKVAQPFVNHKGSTTIFGPDGFLYVSLGDGGSAGDPFDNAQNLAKPLGKILRIDVNSRTGTFNYGIPPDNPFLERGKALPEIWAYGLRNVWRMSFDRQTGVLWAGDVGQEKYEEIDIIQKGGNYGWNFREGKHPYRTDSPPAGVQFIEPVAEYWHNGGASITGGYVYRGRKLPHLAGVYLYADFVTGEIWGLRHENGRVAKKAPLLRQKLNIASFAEDEAGEIYLLAFDGKIYELVESAP